MHHGSQQHDAHANLVGDVIPILLAAEVGQAALQGSAHSDNAIGHALDLAQPAPL
jgi:hypothetical protein